MLVTMSDKELSRINIIQSVVEKRMRRRDAAHQLALTERQTQRLMNRFRESGAAGLANLRRGRPGNHRLPESLKLRVLSLLHDHYSDFGPTLAAEKLRERHNITVSVETLRKWMTADGLWVPYSRRRPRVHQPRYRRDCLGELVQIDGSPHDWFEGRAPKCCLLVFIDDATGRLMGTVAKLAMRQPFVLFKGLTFQKLCLPGAFRPGDHHNKMLRPGLCVVHASPQYL